MNNELKKLIEEYAKKMSWSITDVLLMLQIVVATTPGITEDELTNVLREKVYD